MKTKNKIAGLLTILTALLLVSTVSAVPYTQEQPYVEQQNITKEKLDKIQQFMNSPIYKKMRKIIDEHLSLEDQESISSIVSKQLKEIKVPLLQDPILDLLITIAEVVMLLLGHNLFGQTVAFLIVVLAVIPYSLGAGLILGIQYGIDLAYSFFSGMIDWDFIMKQFGLLGLFVIGLGLLVFTLIIVIVCIPISVTTGIIFIWLSYVAEMFNYIYG